MSLIADCFDVLLVDNTTGSMIASTTLSSADINITADEKEVRAGRGDALIAVLHSGRKVDVKLSEVTFKYDWIAQQLGQTVGDAAATTAWALSKWYECVDIDGAEVGTAIGFTLDEIPLATGSGLKIYDSTGKEVALTTGYTITGKEVTITTGVIGDRYEVRGYKYTTAATATTINIDHTSFAKGVTCVLETLEIEEDESELAKVQYIFESILPSGNVTISTKKERDANVTDFTFKAIKPKDATCIGKVIRIPLA
jgi:hypothetical protein